MSIVYERKINYYETDRMGIVHHSNYIRYMEEARCYMLEKNNLPFEKLESCGITIPVLGVNCSYKHHVSFGDTILIKVFLKTYTGTRLIIQYEVVEKETNKLVMKAESEHCFTNIELRPVNLKKYAPEFSQKVENLVENIKEE